MAIAIIRDLLIDYKAGKYDDPAVISNFVNRENLYRVSGRRRRRYKNLKISHNTLPKRMKSYIKLLVEVLHADKAKAIDIDKMKVGFYLKKSDGFGGKKFEYIQIYKEAADGGSGSSYIPLYYITKADGEFMKVPPELLESSEKENPQYGPTTYGKAVIIKREYQEGSSIPSVARILAIGTLRNVITKIKKGNIL